MEAHPPEDLPVPITTREAKIPSLRIDRDFLAALGAILERDARALEGREGDNPESIHVSYIMESGVKRRTRYASMDELLDAPLPPRPRKFEAYIHPSDRNLVEVSLQMEPRASVAALSTCKLSSSDETRLKEAQDALTKLFRGAKHGYHSWLPHFMHRIFAALVSVASAWLYLRWVDAQDIRPGLGRDLWWAAIVPVAFIAYQGSLRLLRRFYPKYEFVLGDMPIWRRRVRLIVAIALVVLVLVAAADLLL
jgi:hypothetical protein